MPRPEARIALLLSDVDGTLVTRDKRLTPRTIAAVHQLRHAGIGFAVTSSRPPAGLATVVAELGIETPIAGFNGGMIVAHDGEILHRLVLDPAAARITIEILLAHHADVWVFEGNDWWVTDPAGAYVAKERRTIGYGPRGVAEFAPYLNGVTKIVGSSADPARLIAAKLALQQALGNQAAASLSQPYYLDITHADANKGGAVRSLGRLLDIPTAAIATIGDGENDTHMFAAAGFAIAMGNANDFVRGKADHSTTSNEEDGFANAVDRFILPLALS